MNQTDSIKNLLGKFARITSERDGTRVTTQCMYPSNAFVRIVVRGGSNTFYVSDEGAAIAEVESAGAWIEKPDRLVSPLVSPMGLLASKGAIMSRSVEVTDLALAIALVANASKHVAEWLFSHVKVRPAQDFKEVVSNFLRSAYQEAVRSEVLLGLSNKPHKFENIVFLPDQRRLIVDPVINDRSSINSRVVANLDLKSANYSDLEQRIVYDDREDWKAEDLNLLQVGAPVIAYSKARSVLDRLGVKPLLN